MHKKVRKKALPIKVMPEQSTKENWIFFRFLLIDPSPRSFTHLKMFDTPHMNTWTKSWKKRILSTVLLCTIEYVMH